MSNARTDASPSSSDMSWVTLKVDEIKQHAAWMGDIDAKESEKVLKNQRPYTYLLRQGKDIYHYFMSFIDGEYNLRHVPIRMELSLKGWFYRNGTGAIRPTLSEIILYALHCEPLQSSPFKKSDMLMQF
jgi:hypothetical protein